MFPWVIAWFQQINMVNLVFWMHCQLQRRSRHVRWAVMGSQPVLAEADRHWWRQILQAILPTRGGSAVCGASEATHRCWFCTKWCLQRLCGQQRLAEQYAESYTLEACWPFASACSRRKIAKRLGVLGALREVDVIDDSHVRAVLEPRLPGLGHADRLQKEVDACVERIWTQVCTKVQAAKAGGAKFCISADSCKPKMRLRRSYVAVYLHWINADWVAEAACCGVRETFPPRTGENYRDHFLACLKSVGLETRVLSCGLSDHEGSIRKGLRLLCVGEAALPLVGCGCHCGSIPHDSRLPARVDL